MKNTPFFAALLLALPLAATAQTTPTTTKTTQTAPAASTTATPAPGTQQVTETTEELDPATGKVIRRTTRTTTVPAGTVVPGKTTSTTPSTATELSSGPASDALVSSFLKTKTTVSTLTAPALITAYSRFMDRVHADRQGWTAADWSRAASVLSSLNGRYDQLRSSFSLDDKVNIRTQQAEFQTLRTARQLSDQVSDKL